MKDNKSMCISSTQEIACNLHLNKQIHPKHIELIIMSTHGTVKTGLTFKGGLNYEKYIIV